MQRRLISAVASCHQGLKSEAHMRLVLANGAAARGLMLQHNLRLVISIAKNYRGRGVEMQDLIQVPCCECSGCARP